MCLVDKNKVRYADKDIPIFKLALKIDNKYYSPYQTNNRLWRVNTTDFTICEGPLKYTTFSTGYFHAFTCIEEPNRRAGYSENLVVLTGYIPEGTRYAIEDGEICAHKMILNI